MLNEDTITNLQNSSLKRLKELSNEIQNQKPVSERKVITFSRNFTLSLSNYCVNQCGYCFYNHRINKSGKDKNVVLINNRDVSNLIEQGVRYQCKEALLMSGENPGNFEVVQKELKERNFNNFLEFVKKVSSDLLNKDILPHTNIGILSFEELKDLKPYNASMGLMLESSSLKLLNEGGNHKHSPTKAPPIRISHIKNAGKLKIPFTTGLLMGIGESFEDRIQDLLVIKEIHEEYEHIQEVILQNFTCAPGIQYHPDHPISIKDLLKITGIAKIIFQNEIAIQVPPNLISGYEKDFLKMGIDDFGGISPFSIDFINPEKPWPQIEQLSKICSNNGFQLRERLPVYDKFIKKEGFIPENIKKKLHNNY